jgi:hypothetical protein
MNSKPSTTVSSAPASTTSTKASSTPSKKIVWEIQEDWD